MKEHLSIYSPQRKQPKEFFVPQISMKKEMQLTILKPSLALSGSEMTTMKRSSVPLGKITSSAAKATTTSTDLKGPIGLPVAMESIAYLVAVVMIAYRQVLATSSQLTTKIIL